MLENVQNNVQEPALTSFNGVHRESVLPSVTYLSAEAASFARQKNRSACPFVLLLVIPVDSFSFGFIARLSPPPVASELVYASIVFLGDGGLLRNGDQRGKRDFFQGNLI